MPFISPNPLTLRYILWYYRYVERFNFEPLFYFIQNFTALQCAKPFLFFIYLPFP